MIRGKYGQVIQNRYVCFRISRSFLCIIHLIFQQNVHWKNVFQFKLFAKVFPVCECMKYMKIQKALFEVLSQVLLSVLSQCWTLSTGITSWRWASMPACSSVSPLMSRERCVMVVRGQNLNSVLLLHPIIHTQVQFYMGGYSGACLRKEIQQSLSWITNSAVPNLRWGTQGFSLQIRV